MSEWKWWAGTSDEWFDEWFDTKADALKHGQSEYDHLEGFYICEATQDDLNLTDYINVDRIFEYAEDCSSDFSNENGDIIFVVPASSSRILEKAIKKTVDEWQRSQNLTFTPWGFSNQRNEEYIKIVEPSQ